MYLPVFTRLLLLFIAAPLALPAMAGSEEVLHIPRTTHPPMLADYLAGPPADAGVEISELRQNSPGDGQPASQKTRVYLSHDSDNLYAVFIAEDDPAQVRARMSKREDIFGDDAVTITIDTFHDKQHAFRFYANPLGVQLDAMHTDGRDDDFNFDTQWESEGQLTGKGYVVKLAIPFKSLRFPKGGSQRWGIAVGRVIARENEFSYWPYITQREAGFTSQMATAVIDDAISPGSNIQINPYINLGRSRSLNKDDGNHPYWEQASNNRAGIDAKFVLADAFAVDLTLRPDFSEVESDAPQVTVDKRYEVLFPEKRPFFLENASFFQTAQPLFFSRRVADPTYGARITGRDGNWFLGGLLINDTDAGKSLAPNDPNAGKDARILISRVQNNFADNSNAGVMLTNRSIGNASDSVADADLRYKLDDNWIATTQLAASRTVTHTSGAPQADRQGHLAYLELLRADRNFNYSGKFLDISPDFNTALGFLPRTDIRQTTQFASYLWTVDNHPWLQQIGPQLTVVGTRDHNNVLQDWSTDATFITAATRGTTLELHALNGYELYEGLQARKRGYQVVFATSWYSWMDVNLSVGQNQVINYTPANGMAPFLGDARSWSASIVVRPFRQWRLEETAFWNDLRTPSSLNGYAPGTGVYRDLLSRTAISYQHDRFLGVRLILDYDYLKTNAALNGLQPGKRLNSDLQLNYILSPGTSLYAGYTDLQENLHLIGNPQILQSTDNLAMQTGRKFYVKFSYLFQL